MVTLLDVAKLRTKQLTLGDVTITVREVGALEFSEYGIALRDATGKNRAVAVLLAACVVDDEGKPLHTADEMMVVAASARTSLPIINAIMELSGYRESPDAGESDAG